jgi:Protein of unknown function (DUF2628)
MPTFAILEPPQDGRTAIEQADRCVFLHERFNLGAFLFGPLWMLRHRLWLVLISYLVGMGLIAYGLRAFGAGWIVVALVFALVHLLVGLEATTLVRWTRVRHGWREGGVVIADELDMAERRFFDSRTAPHRATAAPAPLLSPGPLAAGQVGPSPPDIIGLFPEPGGGR